MNVSCIVTYYVGISQVILLIQDPNGSWNSGPMVTKTAGRYYYRSPVAFSKVGLYHYYICAKDMNNNIACSSNLEFLMPPPMELLTSSI
jgi:hypothetical protein